MPAAAAPSAGRGELVESGNPSRRAQISATVRICASSIHWAPPARSAVARSRNRATAGDFASSSMGAVLRSGRSRGGTGNSYSPYSRNAARLVTTIFSWSEADKSSVTSGDALNTCSKLSSRSKVAPRRPGHAPWRRTRRSDPRSAASSAHGRPRKPPSPGRRRHRIAQKTRPGKIAQVVFRPSSKPRPGAFCQCPPGLVSVTSRTCGCRTSCRAPASSWSRPTSAVRWAGRLCGIPRRRRLRLGDAAQNRRQFVQ